MTAETPEQRMNRLEGAIADLGQYVDRRCGVLENLFRQLVSVGLKGERGERGEPGAPGKASTIPGPRGDNGRDGQPGTPFDMAALVARLKADPEFIRLTKGERGERGRDGFPGISRG